MKKLIKLIFVSHIVILFLLVPVLSFTQDMDSLWGVWNDNNQPDTSRLNAADKLLYQGYYKKAFSSDSVLRLSDDMYGFALNKGLMKFQSEALKYLGNTQRFQYKIDEAYESFVKRLSVCEQMNDKKGLAETYMNLGFIYTYREKNEEALNSYLKSLKFYRETKDSIRMGYLFNHIGFEYMYNGNFELSRAYQDSSMMIWENRKQESIS